MIPRSRSSTIDGERSETAHPHTLTIYLHSFNPTDPAQIVTLELLKRNTTEELIAMVLDGFGNGDANKSNFDLFEVMGSLDGQMSKERKLDKHEYPLAVEDLWPKSLPTAEDETTKLTEYRFVLRQRGAKSTHPVLTIASAIDEFLARFLQQPQDKEYPDLCMLPELTEKTLLDNLRQRFNSGHIYTYIGPILVAVNPFKFFPIYNPKYAIMYQNKRLGTLPPHIFAIADACYHDMLKCKENQCIVISGESGSGKTESTNFLLHHLTTLSQKGSTASGLEQILLCAGPVLEAFGNAVTAQNNNSSRFGKFMQIHYRESGIVCGANVQIYLLEKSRIISQAKGERNYHVFYYLLEGASEKERQDFYLWQAEDYHYLNQNEFYCHDSMDGSHEFNRLRKAMDSVGFSMESQKKIFSVLSAVLLLGNVQFVKRQGYHCDDNAYVSNEEVVSLISKLLQVKEENLLSALTTRRTVLKNETVVTRYKVSDALNTKDAMAKCLYNALFHWIVLRINQALLKDTSLVRKGFYIGILDIFGFEDIGLHQNSFEQFCINYANERLQQYFNEHIFKLEQEEYTNQGIVWTNIDYTDNTECLQLMQSKPYGLFSLIDEESSIQKGTDQTLLQKFNEFHKNNEYYEVPQKKELAFVIAHYAGKVKYQISDFREKNKDLMRQDVVNALKNSKSAFVRELIGTDPVAVFRWAVVRASFRALFAFRQAGTSIARASSTKHLAPPEMKTELKRRGSESHLNALLRGELSDEIVPSFCDTSMFGTIVEHARSPQAFAGSSSIHSPGVTTPKIAQIHQPVALRRKTVLSQAEERRERLISLIKTSSNIDLPTTSGEQTTWFSHIKTSLQETERLLVKKAAKPKQSSQGLRALQALKVLAQNKKQPQIGRKSQHTVGAQFQSSLSKLMETLSHARPFFIRCVKSNSDKVAGYFDEDIILQQLRYTGMLETVRIRRAGYSVRLTYDEFIAQYRILLKEGRKSEKMDVMEFIYKHPFIDHYNVQFGHTKIFMRDAEKLLLDDQLHKMIMLSVLKLQSWFRVLLARKHFLTAKSSAIRIQKFVRGWLVRNCIRKRALACLCIQTTWRAYLARQKYHFIRSNVIQLQAISKGFLVRNRIALEKERCRVEAENEENSEHTSDDVTDTTIDELHFYEIPQHQQNKDDDEDLQIKIGSPGQQSDEGILTKESSQEDPLQKKFPCGSEDDESSGIQDDSDEENDASLTAVFVLQDSKLKLVNDEDSDASSTRAAARRPSLAPSSSIKTPVLRRSCSSDQLLRSSNEMMHERDESTASNTVTMSPPLSPTSASAKKKSGFSKAKKKLEAFLSRKPEGGFQYTENEDGTLDIIVPSAHYKKHSEMQFPKIKVEGMKPKALSLCPQSLALTGSNKINVHNLKTSRIHKTEPCALCNRSIAGIFVQGYKCSICKLCFHKECSPFALRFACEPAPPSPPSPQSPSGARQRPWAAAFSPVARLNREASKHHQTVPSSAQNQAVESSESSMTSGWSLTRTTQQTDPTNQIIASVDDLRQFSIFIFKKQTDLATKSEKTRDTLADALFKKSLREFHMELISYEATLREDTLILKYRDLITSFEGTLTKVCVKEQVTFPLTLGINAFRGFLNEFIHQRHKADGVGGKLKAKVRSFRKKRRKSDVTVVYLNHRFKSDIVHVPTFCEVCNQFMWHAEKILICLGCRVSCHKKCHSKMAYPCSVPNVDCTGPSSGRIFGVALAFLVSEENPVPLVVEKMLLGIEVRGMYMEGIYRKSGSISQIKQLKRTIEMCKNAEELSFDAEQVHVLTSLVKAFFRELPEPLLTFELYENFVNVSEIQDYRERVQCLCGMIEMLPKSHKSLLDRLMYHLARIAHHADSNRMSASNLAVVFAPCLLRRAHAVHAQDQLMDVSHQAICVQTLIEEKLRQYHSTVEEIVQLESATEKVTENLRRIEEHVRRNSGDDKMAEEVVRNEIEQARRLFVEQLEFLDKEKDKLIEELPPLAPVALSEDDCLTSSDENELIPCAHRRATLQKQYTLAEEYAIDLAIPPILPSLKHYTRDRAPRPKAQRRPTNHWLLICNDN